MQSNGAKDPGLPHSSTGELLSHHYQSGAPPPRNDFGPLASLLQQQGVMSPNVNLSDPNVQAHVFHLITQLGSNQPNAWASASQGGSHNLEHLLTQISQRPEIVANLPGLLNSLASQQSQHQKLDSGNVAAADGGPNTYTAQLYGGPTSGLGPDSDGKADGADDLGGDGLGDMDPSLKTNSVKCAKEKNRQAQRRFRERQKGLIQALKDRTDQLQKQVDDQRRTIETLEKENQVLKVILQEKNKA